jgi:hypothetical protein
MADNGVRVMSRSGLEHARDHELVELASQPAGGGGAIVEAMNRLRVAVEKASVSADRHSRILVWLTGVLISFTAALIILTAVLVNKDVWHWW